MQTLNTNDQNAKLKRFADLSADLFNHDQVCLDLARAAAELCDAPVALVSLKVGERLWFQTRIGLDVSEIPSRSSFCECAMELCDEVLVVEDATVDPRFANNDLVAGPLGIRFYVGAPLVTSKRHVLGNLCVLDSKSKKLKPGQIETLAFLGKQVAEILEKKLDSLPA